ncbi:MAG: flavin reductase family protein [Mediterraneibacter sp.]
MNKINIGNASAYTSPNSMTLICTEKPDGSTNLATLAFWAFASTNPGKIMFSLNKGAYSLELLAEKKEAVLAIPGVELTGALIGCGTCSGRDTDKAAQVGLTMQEVEGTNIKAPVPCKLLIHATVAQTMDADDHVVHLCDVKGVYGDEDVDAVFGWKGYAEFAAAQQK